MKLDSTRIDETIAFINNNANLRQAQRQAAAQFCRQTYPKLSPLDFGPYSAGVPNALGRIVAGGAWRFYLQAIDSNTHQIIEARRIF